MTKVLVIGYVWPEPDSSAAGSHMYSLLKLFKRQDWQVTFATPAQKTDHMINLSDDEIDSVEIRLNCNSFNQFIAQLNPDIVLFDRFMMEEQFSWRVEQTCPDALKILDTEDLQCLRAARQNALKNNRTLIQSDLMSDLAKREIAAILRCDLSLIISDAEMQLLQDTYKVEQSLLYHLPFMIELTQPLAPAKTFEQRDHFVTIGNFRHAPNWDSVLYLQQIWPQIRTAIPTAELHIYGSYPPKKATALNNPKTGFLIKGWAENAHQVLADARVCLAPLRFGAGIKGKLIDAMQVNTPSVTTPIGAEGMAGDNPWPGIIADTTESIASAAIELYQNEDSWNKAQSSISQILETRYDAEKLGKNLIDKIQSLRNKLQQHRQNNFIGAMLRHHSMRSTEFMSRWIESKNKLEALADNQSTSKR